MKKPFSETRACERIVKETLTSGWENPSLATMNSDSYDFFDNERGSIAIWELRNLIDRVYEAGRKAGKLGN